VLSEARAAEMLGVPHRTLTAWRRHGDGPLHVKRGRYIRYCHADLIDFLTAHPSLLTRISEANSDGWPGW
jgi:hypothetical protein